MLRRLTAAVITCLAISAAVGELPAQQRGFPRSGIHSSATRSASDPRPIAVLALTPRRSLWTLEARVGGRVRRLLLDTGGGITLLTSGVAADAGCTPMGRVTGFDMFGQRHDGPRCQGIGFELGERTYTPRATALVDMATLRPQDPDLDGSMALDVFEDQAITLELGAGRLTIESPASLAARTRTMRSVPLRLAREVSGLTLTPVVGVATPHGALWMELDSGNGGTVLVSKPVASLVGLDSAARGKQTADFPLVDGVRVQTADAMTPDMIMDGNLGMPFLRHWIVTLDLRRSRAWVAPATPDTR